jgi:hypothetical protein
MEHGKHPTFCCGHPHVSSMIPYFHHNKLYCSKQCYMDAIKKKGEEGLQTAKDAHAVIEHHKLDEQTVGSLLTN